MIHEIPEHIKRIRRKKAELTSRADAVLKRLRTEKNEYVIKKHFGKPVEADPEADKMLAEFALYHIFLNDTESVLLAPNDMMTPELEEAKREAINRLQLINIIKNGD